MPIYFYNGELLFENSAIAMHEDCCCEDNPCDPNPGLWVTISWGAWQGSTAYAVNYYVESTAGDTYQCTTAGTSGGAEPTWDTTIGNTTNDGTAVWTRVANTVGQFGESFANGDEKLICPTTYSIEDCYQTATLSFINYIAANEEWTFTGDGTIKLCAATGYSSVFTTFFSTCIATFGGWQGVVSPDGWGYYGHTWLGVGASCGCNGSNSMTPSLNISSKVVSQSGSMVVDGATMGVTTGVPIAGSVTYTNGMTVSWRGLKR